MTMTMIDDSVAITTPTTKTVITNSGRVKPPSGRLRR
jgi:hypothetical protein